MSFLDAIVEAKQQEIAALSAVGMASFLDQFQAIRPHIKRRSLVEALVQSGRLSLIAEVKKASPSKGMIRHDFHPVDIAKAFENQGAKAISVLTEKTYFLGHPDYLKQIKAQVALPVLRKDFILDRIQIAEAAVLGADAILLIKSILPIDKLQELHEFACELGLEVLVEVHSLLELESVLTVSGIRMIGINNRNLSTFDVDVTLAEQLAGVIQQTDASICTVAESGYQTPKQLDRLVQKGIHAVLIGEGLVKYPDLITYFNPF